MWSKRAMVKRTGLDASIKCPIATWLFGPYSSSCNVTSNVVNKAVNNVVKQSTMG